MVATPATPACPACRRPLPAPPTPPPRERQRRKPTNLYRYVRKVKGRKWQARLWVGKGNGRSVNLGLYETDRAAHQVVRDTLRRLGGVRPTPLAVWRAARGVAPDGVLPKWVRATADGRFVAEARLRAGPVRAGPFGGPEEAHAALAARLGLGLYPPTPSTA